MKKLIKIICCFLSVVLLIPVIVACDMDPAANRPKQLKVLGFRVEDKKYYEWLEKEFEAEYTDINMIYEAVDTANYGNILKSRISGDEVDVFGAQPTFFFEPSTVNNMLDISELKIWDGVYDYVVDECTNGDKKYIAPTSIVAGVVFYNKDLFAAAGITEIPKTWAEFIVVCEKLKTHLGISTQKAPIITGLLEPWPVNIMVDIVEANTVRSENKDFFRDIALGNTNMSDPLVVRLMENLAQISKYFQTAAAGLQYSQVPGYFSSGKYGMMIDGSWQLSQIRDSEPSFEVGSFVLPSNETASKNNNVAYKTGGGFSIYKKSPNIDSAKKFIEFHMRKDIMQKYADVCRMGTVTADVEIKDELAKTLYDNSNYKYVILAENLFVRGMPGYYTNNMVELLQNRKSVAQTIETLSNKHETSKSTWSSYVPDWLAKYYPDQG